MRRRAKQERCLRKREEVGDERALVSTFQKQQAVNDLNKARETYNAQLQKGNSVTKSSVQTRQRRPSRRSKLLVSLQSIVRQKRLAGLKN